MKDNLTSSQTSGGNRMVGNKSSLDSNMDKGSITKSGLSTPVQCKFNNTGLPDNIKTGAERLSGYSLDDVKVHYNSNKPAQLKAHAYAQGSDIHVAPGQEKHLAHEAWHVVQQKQGRVGSTTQMKGVSVNDNPVLEKEADTMGAKAANFTSGNELQSQSQSYAHVDASSSNVAQRIDADQLDDATFEPLALIGADDLTKEVAKTIMDDTTAYEKHPDDSKVIKSLLYNRLMDLVESLQKELDSDDAKVKAEAEKTKKGLSNDTKFWKNFIKSMMESQGNKKADYSGVLKQNQKIGKGTDNPKERITLECSMGQGVIGNLHRYELFSGGFSSCSPIVMYNSKTTTAGLFHYGAGSKSQLKELDKMYKAVAPTYIGMGIHTEDDYNIVSSHFKQKVKAVDKWKSNASASIYINSKGQPLLSTDDHGMALDLTQMKELPQELENIGFDLLVDEKVFTPETFKSVTRGSKNAFKV